MAAQTITLPAINPTTEAEAPPAINPTTEAEAIAAMNAEVVTTQGFTRGQLHEMFDAICDPADWRGPICAWVPMEGVAIAVEAVKFFTATNPTVGFDCATMRCLIESEGYRNGPAGG